MSDWKKEWEARKKAAEERGAANLLRFLDVARPLKVTSVRVDFDGQGDSGSIEEVSFECEVEDVTDATVTITETETSWGGSEGWKSRETEQEYTLEKAIESIVYDMLEGTGVDWYNNEGGFGYFELDVVQGTYTFEVNQRIETHETAHFTEGVIERV